MHVATYDKISSFFFLMAKEHPIVIVCQGVEEVWIENNY